MARGLKSVGRDASTDRKRKARQAGAALALLSLGGIAGAAQPAGMPPPYLKLKGSVENRTIGPLHIANVFRVIETGKHARLRNVTINGIDATALDRDGIRIRGDAEGVRIQNFHLQMRSAPQSSPNLPIGIAVQTGRDIVISDGTVSGFRMIEQEGKYTNGDGIATERPVDGLSIARVRSTDNSDGGFDLKSRNTRLDDLTAERNGRNYRLWGTVEAGTLNSADPRNAHVWVAKGAVVHIRNLVASSTRRAPLIKLEGPAQVTVDHCTLRLPPGNKIVGGQPEGADVHLGPGCSQ
jgi:hypothetical protein